MSRSLPRRRAFLRGLGGISVGLPLLDILLDGNGEALAGGDPLPKRYVLAFGGFSLIAESEAPDGFIPDQAGAGYDLKPAIAPLATHGVDDLVSVVSGLRFPLHPVGEVPDPGGVNFFHRKSPALFCGQRVYLPITDKVPLTSPSSSSDQLVADVLDDGTNAFRSLVYNVQAQHYHTVEAWADDAAMSWRKNGAGDAQILVPQASPQAAFESLFTQFTPPDPQEALDKALELARRGSILDLVDRRGSRLLQRLGAADRARVDEHLTHVRELEQLVGMQMGDPESVECKLLRDPGADPPIGGENPSGFDGWAQGSGYSDEDARARIFTDLLHMALTCDLTRVATLMYTYVASALNIDPIIAVPRTFHSFHHDTATTADQLAAIIAWHVDHFGRLVAKLRDTPEGAGTLLDSCAVVMMNEGGRAPGYGSHTPDDLAFLVAGGAGGLRQGEHIVAAGYHPVNVLITAMNAVGVPTTEVGEISGSIPELVA